MSEERHRERSDTGDSAGETRKNKVFSPFSLLFPYFPYFPISFSYLLSGRLAAETLD
jgi:hypothetical protein